MSRWKISAPASSANLGPGFDILGLALNCPLNVTISLAEDFRLEVHGEGSTQVPTTEEHLIVSTAQEIAGEAALKCHWKIDSQIPMTRGLGSSAAAIGAGLAAGYLLRADKSPDRQELFRELTRREGHGDNAAAVIFGGLQFCYENGSGETARKSIPCQESLGVIAVVPEQPLATSEARSVLPASHETAAVTSNMASLALLVSCLESGNTSELSKACTDQLHEPYRLPLIPGLGEALAELRKDTHLLGSWLSGAGPTLASFALLSTLPDLMNGNGVGSAVAALERAGVSARILGLEIDHDGITWEELS